MRLPPDEIPDNLSAEEYKRLGKLYGLMGRTDKVMDVMNRARQLAAPDPSLTPEEAANSRGLRLGQKLAEHFFKALAGPADNTETGEPNDPTEFFADLDKELEELDLNPEELAQINTVSESLKSIFKSLQEAEVPPRDVPQDLTAEEYYDLGVKYKGAGWTEQARDSLLMAIELDRSGPSGKAAASFLATRIPRHPVPLVAEQMNVEGFNRMHSRDTTGAKAVFDDLIKDYPDFEWPYGNLGSLLIQEGDLAGASEILRKAVGINPYYVNAWLHLARAAALGGDFGSAREYLDRAADADASDGAIDSLRAVIAEVESWED